MRQAALHFIDQIEYRNVGKVPGGLLYEIGRTMDGRDDDRGRDTCEKRNRNGNPKQKSNTNRTLLFDFSWSFEKLIFYAKYLAATKIMRMQMGMGT